MKIILSSALIFLSSVVSSQNWQQLDMGVNNNVTNIFCDSVDNILYVGASNITSASGVPVHMVAKWDGVAWDSMPNSYNRVIGPVGRYNAELYAEDMDLTTFKPTISKWNGSAWINFANFNSGGGGGQVLQNGTDMYLFGSFDTVNGVAASRVAKWNGSVWSALDTTIWGAGTVMGEAVFYQGDLYVSGSFYNWDNSIHSIAKWDGSSWSSVGGGVLGPLSHVQRLEVYQGELYVAGSFLTTYGNADNNIQKWDGSTWKPVGGGVTGWIPTANGQVHDMCVHDNKLYVVGVFMYAGGVPAKHLACWDGLNWCSSGAQPGDNIGSIGSLNNELYVGINSDDTLNLNYIAKWVGGPFSDSCTANVAGIYEANQTLDASVYPNPADDEVNIEFEAELNDVSLRIQNILGQQMYFEELKPKEMQVKIDIRSFPSGIYMISLLNDRGMTTRKFIKH